MSRAPGKKFKVHDFDVEGMVVPVQIRITDKNRFYAEVDGEHYETATFDELEEEIRPRLEQLHKLVYDPVIDVDYVAEGGDRHTHYGSRENWERQEVKLSFTAGWVSRTPVSTDEDRYVFHRWVRSDVDATTGQLAPLNKDRMRHYSDRMSRENVAELIPFTSERWEKLLAISRALADVRDRLASLLKNGGAHIDALPVKNLLSAMPAIQAGKGRP